MKRILGFVCILCMILTLQTGICAESQIDYSVINERPDVYDLDLDDEGENAYISVKLDKSHFRHKNSPEEVDSLFYSDIIIIDYYSSPRAIWRLWVDYTAKSTLGITSATFTLDDTDYTFDVASSVGVTKYDDFILEDFGIVIGSNNSSFWSTLLLKLIECEDYAAIEKINIPVVLHGAMDDVSFVIPADALVTIYFIGDAMLEMVGIDGIIETDGTIMKEGT